MFAESTLVLLSLSIGTLNARETDIAPYPIAAGAVLLYLSIGRLKHADAFGSPRVYRLNQDFPPSNFAAVFRMIAAR